MNIKKTFIPLLLFYSLLLVLPIVDYIFHWSEDVSGPGVALRAILTIVMALVLITRIGRKKKLNGIIVNIVLIMLYMAIITFWHAPQLTFVYPLVRVCYPLFGFVFVYELTKDSRIEENSLTSFYFILIIIIAVTVYLNIGHRVNTTKGLGLADNTGYALVCAYSGIVFLTKKKTFPIILLLVFVGTMISGKRGAIIAMILATIPLFQYVISGHIWKRGKIILYILLIVVGVVVVWHHFGVYFDAALARLQALEEDGGSGRDIIAQRYINGFKSSTLFLQLFGHGIFAGTDSSGSVYALGQAAAHNDWIELLYDFGVIGVLLYFSVFVKMMVLLARNRKEKDLYYGVLAVSFVIWLTKSIFSSTFLMDVDCIYVYMAAAYAIAKIEQKQTFN